MDDKNFNDNPNYGLSGSQLSNVGVVCLVLWIIFN